MGYSPSGTFDDSAEKDIYWELRNGRLVLWARKERYMLLDLDEANARICLDQLSHLVEMLDAKAAPDLRSVRQNPNQS